MACITAQHAATWQQSLRAEGLATEHFEAADVGAECVIAKHRQANYNLRTHFERIIGRAGLVPWPRPFHNLRASRQTELTEAYPARVVWVYG